MTFMISVISYPPLRITTLLVVLGLGVSVERLEALLGLLILAFIWLAAGRVPVRFFWHRLRLILLLIVFMFVFFPWLEGDEGWAKAAMYAMRLIFAVQVLTLLFHEISIPLFLQSLLRLKVPSVFVEMMGFTLRYLDLFRQEAESMLRGFRSRGYRVRSRWFSIRAYFALSKVVGSLLLRVFRRSERVYLGMLSRGYRGVLPRQPIPALRPGDGWRAAWMLLAALGLFTWERLG
jgi:cobalt/nickel transport system permease protein